MAEYVGMGTEPSQENLYYRTSMQNMQNKALGVME